MAFILSPEQAVNDELDWTISYDGFLSAGEVIALSTWSAAAGVTIFAQSNDDTAATAWLKGGQFGGRYLVSNTITTNSVPPRIVERSFYLSVVQPVLAC